MADTAPPTTDFDPNYQGDPATKRDVPADGSVLEKEAEPDPPGVEGAGISVAPGGGPTSGAGLEADVREIDNERAEGTGGHAGPAG